MLSLYTDIDECTPFDGTMYSEDEEESTVQMGKSDAVLRSYEAEGRGDYESAGVWLLVASSCGGPL